MCVQPDVEGKVLKILEGHRVPPQYILKMLRGFKAEGLTFPGYVPPRPFPEYQYITIHCCV